MVLSDFRIDISIDKNKNNESQRNSGEELRMKEDGEYKIERVDLEEEVKVLEVLRRGYLKNKEKFLNRLMIKEA